MYINFYSCLIILFFSALISNLFGQDSLTRHQKYFLGLETGWSILYGKFPNTEDKYHDFAMRLNPYTGYAIHKDIFVGVSGSVEFVNSTYAPQEPAYGLGGFTQYLLPVKLEKRFTERNRLVFLSRIIYLRTNYYLGEGKFVKIINGNLTEDMLGIDVGLNIRLFKQFYFQQFFRHDIFFGRNKVFTHRQKPTRELLVVKFLYQLF